MRACKTVAVAALGLALAACGGGGGGGGDDGREGPQAATGDFTADNYQAETDAALEPLLLAFAFDGTVGTARPFAGGDSRARAAAADAAGVPAWQAGRFERRLLEALIARESRVQAAEYVGSTACSGGGFLDFDFTYANPDAFTPGDRIDVTSDGCIEDGQLIGGRLSLVLSAYDDTGSSIGFEARLVADDFGGAALRIDGTGRLTLATNVEGTAGTGTITYAGMSVAAGGEQLVWDHGYSYVFTETSETLVLDGYVAVDGRYYDIRQDVPFAVDASGVLASGRAALLDKDGDRVQIDAAGGNSSYTFFAAGSSTPTGPVTGRPLGN